VYVHKVKLIRGGRSSVDLGVETLVAQVNLINSGDNAGSDIHFAVYYFMKLSVSHNLHLLTTKCYITLNSFFH